MTIQINHAGNAYAGKNQEVLSQIALMRGYKSNQWFTFLQAKNIGVLTDAKGQGVAIKKLLISKGQDSNGIDVTKKGLRSYVVFNMDLIVKYETEKQA